MKRSIFLFCCLLVACGSEKGVELAKPFTFVRYYNGGFADQAKVIKQVADGGFIILSNGLQNGFGASNPNGAKVIKTDIYGNQVWQRTFFTSATGSTDSGKDILILENGYLLLGASNIVTMDLDGKTVSQSTLSQADGYPNIKVNNKAATIKGANIAVNTVTPQNYLVTGLKGDSIFLGEINKTTFVWSWYSFIGNTTNIVNKLFVDANNKVYWAINASAGSKKIKLVQATQQTSSTSAQATSAQPIGTPGFDQEPYDLARAGNGFVITGSTKNDKGDNDICYYRLTDNVSLLGDSKNIDLSLETPVTTSTAGGGQVVFYLPGDQVGNSIASTQDGGFIILGTVDAANIPNYVKKGNKTEYMLTKVDGFGNLLPGWPKYYGSKDNDSGASVIQAADGSFVILGTTVFNNTETIFLMKTDKDGNIQ